MIIKVDDSVIAAAKSCTIDTSVETIKISSPSNGGWEYSRVGRKSWSVSTNHLVTNINDGIDMVGTNVIIEIANVQLGESSQALPFAGTVSGVTTETSSTTADGVIMWDTANLIFVKRVGDSALTYKYYMSWEGGSAYITPSEGDVFYDTTDGAMYIYSSEDLETMNRTGGAIVKSWRGTFTRGNLAQGSFTFLGTGPLTTP